MLYRSLQKDLTEEMASRTQAADKAVQLQQQLTDVATARAAAAKELLQLQ